ncbi:Mediator of RNA polymerase II transcription subunit 9 [Mycena indigotica]|uniref:Mediator of RNA polymerase II transcription subunit 9 n=1 Tax=Mycena indigotica TaxID=2126181 RepID=A0A8H6W116_9AGAR|nr:Mediator of RNA polymerase II transcription subunit 9 [Mycena indigotica]KAF7301052.1 Mediator of RNA polymerase II transcription subunit 9 [Mycena indigotica]
MTTNPLPVALFDSLLPKLITVLELIQGPDGTVTPQARQAVLNATNEFKSALNQAKELATNLPGGNLRTEEQVEVIAMLTELRDRKRRQLAEFATRSEPMKVVADTDMEVDSEASTPFVEEA